MQSELHFSSEGAASGFGDAIALDYAVNLVSQPRDVDERRTIILVEDEDSLREIISERLRREGYEVYGAASAIDARALLAKHRSQRMILLTDLVLPGVGGWFLARSARETIPDLPIIFMSGCIDEATISSGLARGNTAYLQKPFQWNQLRDTLEMVMGDRDMLT